MVKIAIFAILAILPPGACPSGTVRIRPPDLADLATDFLKKGSFFLKKTALFQQKGQFFFEKNCPFSKKHVFSCLFLKSAHVTFKVKAVAEGIPWESTATLHLASASRSPILCNYASTVKVFFLTMVSCFRANVENH